MAILQMSTDLARMITKTLPIDLGGTGQTTALDGFNALAGGLTNATGEFNDSTFFITSNNSGATGDYYRRSYSILKGDIGSYMSAYGNSLSATYVKDYTDSSATYLNYGAGGLAASAITWLTCWNGYELRAISKAEMANAVDGAHKWVRIDGDTMTGSLHTTYKSASWVNSLTNAAVSLDDSAGSYGGWICGPTKDGRIAISTYQNNDNYIYLGYGERGRTTNSFATSIRWDGPNNILYTNRQDMNWLRVINDSSNNTDDAMVYLQNQSSSDWALKINCSGYNYGIQVNTADGAENAIQTNGVVRGCHLKATAGYLYSTANGVTVQIGAQNSSWVHFTGGPQYYFNNPLRAVNSIGVYNTNTYMDNNDVHASRYVYTTFTNQSCGVENGTITNIIYDNGDGWLRKASYAHLCNTLQGNFLRYNGWWTDGSGQSVDNAHGMIFAYHSHGLPGSWGVVTTFDYGNDSAYRHQIYGDGYNSQMYFRVRSSDRGGWYGGWKRLVYDGDSPTFQEVYVNGWVRFANYTGLYSPNNNAHFLPNAVSSYGQWRLDGSRGSYSGIHLGPNTNYMTVMSTDEHMGLFKEGNRWLFYYQRSTDRVGIYDSNVSLGYNIQLNGRTGILVNSYPSLHCYRTDAGETSIYLSNNTAGWAMGLNVWGIGAGGFGIGQYSGTGGSTWRFRIDNSGYCYTSSYLNLGAGNENNASSPPVVWGLNGGDNYLRTYQTTSLYVKALASTGYGSSCMTYLQTPDAFDGNSGWCHYIICNHGDGASYYHYTLGLPFWGPPVYRRQTGNTSTVTKWYKFWTEENLKIRKKTVNAGSSSYHSLGLDATRYMVLGVSVIVAAQFTGGVGTYYNCRPFINYSTNTWYVFYYDYNNARITCADSSAKLQIVYIDYGEDGLIPS